MATRNFEVDSGAYFISLLFNLYNTPGVWAPEKVLNDSLIHDAVLTMISTWQVEQHHEERSPYRWGSARAPGRIATAHRTGAAAQPSIRRSSAAPPCCSLGTSHERSPPPPLLPPPPLPPAGIRSCRATARGPRPPTQA